MNVYKLNFLFALAGGEVANCGVHYQSIPVGNPDFATVATSLSNRAGNYWAAIRQYYTDGVFYLGNTVTRITVGGTTQEVFETVLQTPSGGATQGRMLPQGVAIVVSLKAGSLRSQRGRMYLPNPVVTACTDQGRLESAAQDAILAASATLFQAGQPAGLAQAVVYSRKTASVTPVTSIRVGNVFDSQRGRRSDLNEAYRTAQLVG